MKSETKVRDRIQALNQEMKDRQAAGKDVPETMRSRLYALEWVLGPVGEGDNE